MEWINCSDRLPPHGETVVVFRPQVLTEDHSDKPIRESFYNAKRKRFDCWHQPTKWLEIKKPQEWNEELEARQNKDT
jgi:hypothetical protein